MYDCSVASCIEIQKSIIMKRITFLPIRSWLSVVAFVTSTFFAVAASETTTVVLKTISGNVEYSTTSGQWRPLQINTKLVGGSIIRTHAASTVDFYLQESKTTLRLTPESRLAIESLQVWRTGVQNVTDIKLRLLEGSIVGSQRKLAKPSHFEIETPRAVASIVGTEYVVRADGAVTVLSGSVSVIYNLPGNQGSVQVNVLAGQSFDPAIGNVVQTTPDFLNNIIAHIDTVKHNAEVFKAGGATVVVKPEEEYVSPTKPKGNNGVGNGIDPQPPGNPPVNDGPGTGPGNPGNKGGANRDLTKGNNGVGNGVDPQPPGNPPINDDPGTPGDPGNKGGPSRD